MSKNLTMYKIGTIRMVWYVVVVVVHAIAYYAVCEMSIHFSGSRSRSGGLISAIAKQLREVNLKLVNKIIVKFDPFHKNVTETRLVNLFVFLFFFFVFSFFFLYHRDKKSIQLFYMQQL